MFNTNKVPARKLRMNFSLKPLKMTNSKNLTISLLILFCSTFSYGQNISTGLYSGVNFSNIHGEEAGGRWKTKPGPVQGFNLGYMFNKSLGIQTGLSFTTLYYEYKSQSNSYYPIDFYINYRPYNDYFAPYYNTSDKMDFRYMRVPLLVSVSIPSAVLFNLQAGIYYSFLQDQNLTENYYSSIGISKAKKVDFGYMFSSGVSYPVTDNIEVGLNINYITGRKHFLEGSAFRNGSSELAMTFNYEFLKKNKPLINTDSSKKVTVTYLAGVNVSWDRLKEQRDKYSTTTGPMIGFNLNFDLGAGFSMITGVYFERKGYSFKDSSELYYRYFDNHNTKSYVDSKVQIDYAVIPLMMRIPIGKSEKFFINTGPWLGIKLNSRNVGVAYKDNIQNSNYSLDKTVIYDDFAQYIKDTDMGWLISGHVIFSVFKASKLDLGVRYSLGYDDIFDASALSVAQYPKHVIRNRTVSFVLGFTLPTANR